MNLEYTHLLPDNFHEKSKVWIYQSSRLFRLQEALEMEETLARFTEQWTSHGAAVKGYANLFFGQFIILIADETAAAVNGCSTDSSVHFIKQIERQYGVDLFNRNNLAFLLNDKIQLLPLNHLLYAFENRFLSANTLYFNNLVLTKRELMEKWIISVKDSWLAKKLKLQTAP